MTDQEIEIEIQAKGLTAAPRITPADVEANIDSEFYFTAAEGVAGREVAPLTGDVGVQKPLHLLTFCVLVLKNGFTVTGENACVSPENHDPELGRKRARKKAIDKVWELMGYELKERLAAKPNKVTIRTEQPTDVEIPQGFSNQPEADLCAKLMIRELVGFDTLVQFKDEKGVVIGTAELKLTPEGEEAWKWEGDKDKAVFILMREYLSKRRVL